MSINCPLIISLMRLIGISFASIASSLNRSSAGSMMPFRRRD
jgi:hypothetical protein